MHNIRVTYKLPEGTDFARVAADTIAMIKAKIKGANNPFYKVGWMVTGRYGDETYITYFVECNIITQSMLIDIQHALSKDNHYRAFNMELLQ